MLPKMPQHHSSIASKLVPTLLFLLLFLSLNFLCSTSQSWIKAGYHYSGAEFPVSDIDSTLFTHLICAFAYINSSTYQLSINSSTEQQFSTFTNVVKRKNPTITTLLSIWGGRKDSSIFFSMLNQSSYRRSFIESSMTTARLYGFNGLDLRGGVPRTDLEKTRLGTFLDEWRTALDSEATNSGKSRLLFIMAVYYLQGVDALTYPIDSIRRNLNWVHLVAYDYHVPKEENFAHPHAALYDPSKGTNTNNLIKDWISRGLPASKLVLGLPYHGFAWTLVNPKDFAIGAPASGPAVTLDGSMAYKYIKWFIRTYGFGAVPVFNSTYVLNYCTIGSTWINFDDVEAIKAKISYAKEMGLLGYNVFQVGNDDNWVLSRAAAQKEERDQQNKKRLLVVILVTTAMISTLLGTIICYRQRRVLKSIGIKGIIKRLLYRLRNIVPGTEIFNSNAPNMQVFSYTTIKTATNNFSSENKLGAGGFGPVYKGTLRKGHQIAVKRLSRTSNQGLEELNNEVTLTATLQHVNLVRVLGYCTEREEKMLIYEYMPNRSLDHYLFDPSRRNLLDWTQHVRIIEGVIQGLLYLQEYSNSTIIHRDLKASNILLDDEMNPKISDFGIARVFKKDEHEANTGRIVGTYGYVPPEYVRKGIYSMKYDVYSFGVLLLQVISGKKNTCLHGVDGNLSLLEHAYELWTEGQGSDFIDPTLDDSSSSCKLLRCMQVALLCVQESPVDRPSMLEVSSMLKNETAATISPKKPAFSIKEDEDEDYRCKIREQIYSVNDATISQIVPR